ISDGSSWSAIGWAMYSFLVTRADAYTRRTIIPQHALGLQRTFLFVRTLLFCMHPQDRRGLVYFTLLVHIASSSGRKI
ncbi:hypothetical protein EDD17DRAFT_1595401, partial [Pisolithus thermaeus]